MRFTRLRVAHPGPPATRNAHRSIRPQDHPALVRSLTQRGFSDFTSNKENNDHTIKVIRSRKSVEISVFHVLVGDVMHLFTSDIVPADGIFIKGHSVKCDESSATGESDLLRKVAGDEAYAALEH